jgi:protein TonB
MLVKKNNPGAVAARRREEQFAVNEKKRANKSRLLTKKDIADLIVIKAAHAKKQENQSVLFFQIGLTVSLAIMVMLFNWNFETDAKIIMLTNDQLAKFEEIQDIPLTKQPPPPPPKLIQAPVIIEVPDEEILEEVDITIDVEVTEEMTVEDVVFEEVEIEEVAEEIFFAVESPPAPVGGMKTFYQYVGKNINYPNQARRAGIQGRVFLKFVVNADGAITDITLLKGIGYGCDEEAIKVLRNAPKWQAGKQRGKPVRVFMTLPITFQLN